MTTARPWQDATADAGKALASLRWRDPSGPWGLASSDREGKVWRFATFTAPQADEARAWIEAQEGDGRNIYASLNRVRPDLTTKAKKGDITACVALMVDIDIPPISDAWAADARQWAIDAADSMWAALAHKWPTDLLAPTVTLFSGGGFQLVWECAEPYAEADRIELFERMAQVAQDRIAGLGLNPDHTFNVDRLVRLNRTTNRPKLSKKAKGQADTVATVIGAPQRKYSLVELRAAFDRPPARQAVAHGGADSGPLRPVAVGDDDLTACGADDVLLSIIREGRSAYGVKLKDNSRSAWEWDAVCRMIRLQIDDAQIAGVLLNETWKIGERARERRAPLQHIARLVARARHVTGHAERQFACQDGRPIKCRANYITATHKLGLRLAYNEFADDLSIGGLDGVGPGLDEKATTRVRFAIDDKFGFLPDKELLGDVLADEAVQNRFNPVREHLDMLKWDGTARLDHWLSTYCGAEDNTYTQAVGRIVLIAAVRRVKRPGTKFDYMMILEGPQGGYKSTTVRVMAGNDDWFSDVVPIGEAGAKVIEHTRGKWLIEVAELDGMNNASLEKLKAFCSRVADRGRLAYERRPLDVPRAFVMVGTTNSGSYLADSTGARRFLPVTVGDVDIQGLVRDRDQIMAEAVEREARGEPIVLPHNVAGEAVRKQASRTVHDAWLDVLGPLTQGRNEVWSAECWKALEVAPRDRGGRYSMRLAECLESLRFRRAEDQPSVGNALGVRWVR
jgi:hypothetical protein